MNNEQTHSDNLVAEQKIVESVKAAIDEQQEKLSPEIVDRLQQARKEAIRAASRSPKSQLSKATGFSWDNFWRPIAPMATAAVTIAGVVFYLGISTSVPVINTSWEQDTELLLSADDLELYEDLDFYAWLAETENG